MGRKSLKDEVQDVKLHKKCSSYLLNRFAQLKPGDKKDQLALDIVKKFGISKQIQENTYFELTDDERNELESIYNRLSIN